MRTTTLTMLLILILCSCTENKEHVADAISSKDSLLFMRATGVSTLISDSGVVRYKLIAENWDVCNDSIPGNPATWKFMQGAFLQRFDQNNKVDLYAQADTVYYHKQHLWEMRGRVVINNADGTIIKSEELFYDESDHYMWSNMFTHIEQPDREIEGYSFRSNDKMTDYQITNTRGSFDREAKQRREEEAKQKEEEAQKQAESQRQKDEGNNPNNGLPPSTQSQQHEPNVAPSAPGKLEAEMRRRGRTI